MNEIKYTSDGKKVVIIGNLNSQEKIVQEIFIINGNEVPSGQNFVVKDLHDNPAISWKEKELNTINERFEKEKNSIQTELDSLRIKYKKISNELREKITYISKCVNKISPETFDLLADYICGEIKYIVISEWEYKIMKIEDFNQVYEGNLRLISFFGRDDGSFTYAIGDYHDYSGRHRKFIPCKTKKEAVEILREFLLAKDSLDESDIKIANEYSITLDSEKVIIYKERKIKEYNNYIASKEMEIEKYNKDIANLKDLYK